jgi:hypothetical protein
MKAYIYIAILSFAFYACNGQSTSNKVVKDTSFENHTVVSEPHKSKSTVKEISKDIPKYDMANSLGLLVAKIGDDVAQSLFIYNKNGEVWKQVSFEGNYKSQLEALRPYAMAVDNYLLALKCLEQGKTYYKVVVNEETEEIKYIKVSDRSFKLEKWEEHVVKCFSVDFDQTTNPIKSEPSKNTRNIAYEKDENYHPVKVEGNWLQIKWGTEDHWSYGWIRWKEDNRLIIELFYFA